MEELAFARLVARRRKGREEGKGECSLWWRREEAAAVPGRRFGLKAADAEKRGEGVVSSVI
jgi:hypothetical protein